MVYCGKASQGCKNCRGRRIKCDRAKPECSQCVRISKKCPGYRDQLSLMFRDESTKVIQKAHAQWGIDAANGDSSHSAATLDMVSQSVSSPSLSPSSHPSSNQLHSLSTGVLPSLPRPRSIDRTFDDQGIQFYIDRYVLAHKDEPGDMQSLTSSKWLWHPAQREVMAAVGLAALSNVLGRRDMMILARQRYGAALQSAASLITRPAADTPEVSMRMVVSLALFEVVQGTYRSLGIAGTHIMGAAALVRAWCLQNQASAEGVRALLQLCYPLFIPYHLSGVGLPQPLLDLISFCRNSVDPLDRPAIDLAALIGSYIQTHSCICRYDLSIRAKRNEVIQQLLDIEAKLAVWNRNLGGKWLFRVEANTKLPRQAVFNGKFHVYHDLWVARVLNHYRWARILLNQAVIDLVDRYGIDNVPLISPVERDRALATIRGLAMDVLLGAPSHWKHPALDEGSQISVEFPGKAGGGAPGLPVLILQLKVAACAPGVPVEYWEWALDNMRWVWRFMGMLHAQSMVDLMLAHHDTVSVVTTERTKS